MRSMCRARRERRNRSSIMGGMKMVISLTLKIWDNGIIASEVTDSREIEDEEQAFAVFDEVANAFIKAARAHSARKEG